MTRQTRGLRGKRLKRGVTLVEVLITVSIIALISASVGLVAWRMKEEGTKKAAATSARSVREGVKAWWSLRESSSECPSMQQMVSDEVLDKDSSAKDPWGRPWRIECSDHDVTIYSDGSDRIAGTADDIRIPPT